MILENFEFLKNCKTGQTLVFDFSNNKVSLEFCKTLVLQAAGSQICPLLFVYCWIEISFVYSLDFTIL